MGDLNIVVVLLVAMLICGAFGLLNGLGVSPFTVSPSLPPLCTQTIVYGACLVYTGAIPLGGFRKDYTGIATTHIIGVMVFKIQKSAPHSWAWTPAANTSCRVASSSPWRWVYANIWPKNNLHAKAPSNRFLRAGWGSSCAYAGGRNMATSVQIMEDIHAGLYDGIFTALYGAGQLAAQRRRYHKLLEDFAGEYGPARQLRLYSAPGRTEIGGNHTDHNHGIVLAAAVNLDIIAAVSPNNENILRVKSEGFDKTDEVALSDLEKRPAEQGHSLALVRGIAAQFTRRGETLTGLDVYTTSQVLKGSGLSSSAAFEVCVGEILNGEFCAGRYSPIELAQMGQKAENEYFGKPSGLMDQTASAVGGAVSIDFKNPAKPLVQKTEFDLEALGYALVITDTGGNHADLTPDYAAVRSEMEAVAAAFGKTVLREVPEDEVVRETPRLRGKLGDRAVLRALHFYAECQRVPQLLEAIQAKNMPAFMGHIKSGGHSSFEYNQNAYSLQNPQEQGVPLGLALSQQVLKEQGAWRLQGGGFAGTIQAFVPLAKLEEYTAVLNGVFGAGACYVLRIRETGCCEIRTEKSSKRQL